MSIVSLLNVNVLNNPAKFTDSYEFEITFECLENLKEDLEWKLTYVGSSTSFEHDQELDSLLVGPIPVGVNKFIFTADPPSPDLIPASELVSVTVILLSCSYSGREFVRVGYYVNNEYDTEELRANPPSKVQVDHVARNILAEKPRVTRFNIVWDNETTAIDEFPPEQTEADLAEDDEDMYAAEEEDDDEEYEEGEEVGEEENGAQVGNGAEVKSVQSETTVTDDAEEDLEEDLDEEEIDIEEEIGEESEDESDAVVEKANETSPSASANTN